MNYFIENLIGWQSSSNKPVCPADLIEKITNDIEYSGTIEDIDSRLKHLTRIIGVMFSRLSDKEQEAVASEFDYKVIKEEEILK